MSKFEGLFVTNANLVVGECEVQNSSNFIISSEDSSSKGVVLVHGSDVPKACLGATVYFGKDFTPLIIEGVNVKVMGLDNVLAWNELNPEQTKDSQSGIYGESEV